MVGVLITFRYGSEFNEARVRQVADAARARFQGMPGLRSKAFTVDATKREAINFYVWDSEDAARAFFTPELLERVTGLYGVQPSVQFVQVVALVENVPSKQT
jgi:heme-degrading monooxygenase HmoA